MWSIVLFGNLVRFITERNLWMTPSVVRLVLENFSVEKYQLLLSLSFYLGCSPPKELNLWTISSHAAKYYFCGEVIICGEINVQLLLYSEILYQWFCLPFPCFEPCEEITERVVETSSFGNSGLEFPILMSSGPNVPTASTDGRSHRYLVGWLAQGPFPLLHVDHKVPVTLFSYTASAPHNWIPASVFTPHK